MSLAYRDNPVYLKNTLIHLGIYGLTHEHSRLWVPAITCLIQQRGWSHA